MGLAGDAALWQLRRDRRAIVSIVLEYSCRGQTTKLFSGHRRSRSSRYSCCGQNTSSSPGIGEAVVLECRSYCSRLPCVLDDSDLSSRLQITWRISKVLGFFEFTRLCIYMRPVSAPERAPSSNSFYSMLRIQPLIFL